MCNVSHASLVESSQKTVSQPHTKVKRYRPHSIPRCGITVVHTFTCRSVESLQMIGPLPKGNHPSNFTFTDVESLQMMGPLPKGNHPSRLNALGSSLANTAINMFATPLARYLPRAVAKTQVGNDIIHDAEDGNTQEDRLPVGGRFQYSQRRREAVSGRFRGGSREVKRYPGFCKLIKYRFLSGWWLNENFHLLHLFRYCFSVFVILCRLRVV